MTNSCLICDRIRLIQEHNNPYFVKELTTGFVVVGDNQFYRGLTLFLSKVHQSELHLLDRKFRDQFLSEMADVAEAVFKAFKPRKLNYELLGNKDEHLHWWLIPRYLDDPNPTQPIWAMDKNLIFGNDTKVNGTEIEELRQMILHEL